MRTYYYCYSYYCEGIRLRGESVTLNLKQLDYARTHSCYNNNKLYAGEQPHGTRRIHRQYVRVHHVFNELRVVTMNEIQT